MKGSAGRSAAPGIKILEIQQKCTRNDIYENYVKDREYERKYVGKYKKEGQARQVQAQPISCIQI